MGILLPITSRGTSAAAVLSGLQLLASSLAAAPADNRGGVNVGDTSVCDMAVLLGVDCDDASLLKSQQHLEGAFEGVPGVRSVHTRVFSTEELQRRSRQGDTNTDRGAGGNAAGHNGREAGDNTVVGVCRLWELLAQQAVEDLGCQLIVLLGASRERTQYHTPPSLHLDAPYGFHGIGNCP